MGDLLIRNVSKKTLDGLKARAQRRGRSLQAEALDVLERSNVPEEDGLIEWLARARTPGLTAHPGIHAIREARDQR